MWVQFNASLSLVFIIMHRNHCCQVYSVNVASKGSLQPKNQKIYISISHLPPVVSSLAHTVVWATGTAAATIINLRWMYFVELLKALTNSIWKKYKKFETPGNWAPVTLWTSIEAATSTMSAFDSMSTLKTVIYSRSSQSWLIVDASVRVGWNTRNVGTKMQKYICEVI